MSRRTTLTAIPTAVYPAAAVALLALAANAAALRNGFAGDDVPIVQKNAVVHGFGDLRHLLLGSYWPGTRELYRPLTLLSFATDWTLSGGSPTWLHAVNLLLHAGVCVLLLLLLVRLGAHRWAAAAAVGLFAVHPVHVEAVANMVGRGELLAALFVVAACLVHLRPGPSSPARVAAVCACYFLGLAGKEIAVTLPALLLVLDWFRSREDGEVPRRLPALVRARLPLLVAMTGVLALFLALRVQVTGGATGTGAAPYLADLSTGRRLLVALSLWPQYVRLLVWPADLSFDWGPGILAIPAGVTPAVAMGVGCILLLALAARRDGETGRGWIALAVLWFGFAILPVSQVAFPLGTLLAERTLYLPSVALVMAVQPLWALLGRTRAAAVPAAVTLAVLLAMGGWWSWRRSAVWASTPAIRADLAAHHPESWRAIWDRASESAAAGRMGDALEHYTRALELTHANEPGVNTEAAAYLLEIGSPATAEGLCRRTLAYDPDFRQARLLLAAALLDQGRFAEALQVARATAAAPAATPGERVDLGHVAALALDASGRPDQALETARGALARGTGTLRPHLWLHLARLERTLGSAAAARVAYDSARVQAARGWRIPPLDSLPGPGDPLMRGWGAHRALPRHDDAALDARRR